jgi:hypothetical protein
MKNKDIETKLRTPLYLQLRISSSDSFFSMKRYKKDEDKNLSFIDFYKDTDRSKNKLSYEQVFLDRMECIKLRLLNLHRYFLKPYMSLDELGSDLFNVFLVCIIAVLGVLFVPELFIYLFSSAVVELINAIAGLLAGLFCLGLGIYKYFGKSSEESELAFSKSKAFFEDAALSLMTAVFFGVIISISTPIEIISFITKLISTLSSRVFGYELFCENYHTLLIPASDVNSENDSLRL